MEIRREAGPLLSIVIPTRNRRSYAISAIQSILEIGDSKLELIIQDNSDSRDLGSWIDANVSDPRLRYNFTEHPQSFVGNFNAAARLARGEYVCFIGDDDGVNPEIMEATCWAKSEDMDAVAVIPSVHYLWKGTGISSTLFTKVTGGTLSIGNFNGSIIDANVENEMRMLLQNGGLYYLDYKLPKLYHGIVHRRCLQAVYDKADVYFGGLSPDTFAAISIACVAKRVVVVDYPLTIPGACGVSGSVLEGSIKKHSRRLEDAPHLRYRGEYHWCELVPRIYTVETIWVDSSIAALRAMGREDLVRLLNITKLAAYCIGSNRGITLPVLRDLFMGMRITRKNPAYGAIQFAWSYLTGPGVKFAQRAWNRFLMIIGKRIVHRIDGLENMVEASHSLTHYLKENGLIFSDYVRQTYLNFKPNRIN